MANGTTPSSLKYHHHLICGRSLSTDTLLLLDDCQYLPLTHQQALTFFVDNLPPHVHLVMAGRTDPPLSLAKLRVQGQLLELRAANLAFTVQETHTLLVDTLHLPVSREICVLLAERTEGWAAGLRLAALATQSADDTTFRPDDPKGSFLSDRLTEGRSNSFVVGRKKDYSDSFVSGRIESFTADIVNMTRSEEHTSEL